MMAPKFPTLGEWVIVIGSVLLVGAVTGGLLVFYILSR